MAQSPLWASKWFTMGRRATDEREIAPVVLIAHKGRQIWVSVLLLLGYAVVLAGFTLFAATISEHSRSRLATIESLVERGTFSIDGAAYQTIDKVSIDGRFYSHQPPILAVAGAFAYYPLYLAGFRLIPGERITYNLLTFALNGLPSLIGLVFFFRSLRWTPLPQTLHPLLGASLAWGTLWLPFSVVFNSHGFCAALMATASITSS